MPADCYVLCTLTILHIIIPHFCGLSSFYLKKQIYDKMVNIEDSAHTT